jgi:hypothetical protein
VGQTCFTPPFFVDVERRHKMGIRDWDIVTSYVDSVTTTLKTVTFPKVQEQVKVKNQGNANLTYTIGSQSGTLTPGQSVTVKENLSSFTIQAAAGVQSFELKATEQGTEIVDTDNYLPSDVSAQLNSLTSSLAEKAKQTDLATQVSRIDNLTANVGNASGNSEIVDIRTGYDGYNHASAGNATRNQIKWLPIIDLSVIGNYVASSFINGSGDMVSSGGFRRSNAITIPTGVKTIEIRNWQVNQFIRNVVFYSSNTLTKTNIVGYSSAYEGGVGYTGVIPIPANATYVVFTCPDSQILRSYWYRDEIIGLLQSDVNTLKTSVSGMVNTKVNIDLAKSYYAVIGDTLEIFVSGILECEDWSNYYVQFTGSVNKGNSYKRKWVYTPASGDADFTLKVTVYDNVGNLLSTATTQIKILTRKSSVSTTRNVLCMGDSLTEDGVWPGELKRRLTATGGTPSADGVSNVNFIGSCLTNGVNFEGYGGWNWNSYLTVGETMYWLTVSSGMKDSTMHESVWSDGTNQWTLETIGTSNKLKFKRTIVSGSYTMPASGTLTYVSGGSSDHTNIVFSVSSLASGNPFWNPTTSAVDFTYYCTNLGVSSIDYLVVLLGWNSILNAVVDGNVTSGKSFIDKLHTAFPNCKVIISGLQVPNENGWGYNYGTYVDGQWQKDYLTIKNSAHDLNAAYENWCLETGYSSYLTFSQLCGQFDMEYSYDYLSTPVNVRNTTTEKIFMNCIHPSANGKYQIADAMYRVLESKLS